MSKKHFVRMAAIIAGIKDPVERNRIAREFAALCASTNPNFNRSRFLDACDAGD